MPGQNTHCFVALYEGATVANACLVAATADPEMVRVVARTILHQHDEARGDDSPVRRTLRQGRRRALRTIAEGQR